MNSDTIDTASQAEAIAQVLIDEVWLIVSRTPLVDTESDRIELPDISYAAIEERSRAGAELVVRIDAIDASDLSADVRLSLSTARRLAAGWAREKEWYWLAFDPMGVGFFALFAPSAYSGGFLLTHVHQALTVVSLTDDADAVQHLDFIDDYARLIRQFTERTAGQADRGIHIPEPQLESAITLVEGLRSGGLGALRAVASRSGDAVSEAARNRIEARVSDLVEPAFDELLALLRDPRYAENAPDTVGIGSYPGGDLIYDELVRMHTTLDLSAAGVHDRGVARMARIEGEMHDLLAEVGFDGSPGEYLAALADDPAWRATTDEEIAAHFERYIARFASVAEDYFGRLPKAPYGVEPLPAAVAGSMTFGYYAPPQVDQERGVYRFNGANLSKTSLANIAALTYHELVPGHHLQLALQHETTDVHPLRKHAGATAFNEGWAEYAARFAGEIGMYRTPEERFGRLMMEAFLTSRLVVDTGMNTLGWSLDRGREYMREHSFMGATEIDSETLRYSCDMPAQALAYKLGDDFLFELREEIRSAQGDAFRIDDFHDAVLRVAGLPLLIVADYVRSELL